MRNPLIAGALGGASLAISAAMFSPVTALAHGIAGDRVFPATLTMDDPAVGDELSIPTFDIAPGQTGSGTTEYDYGGEWDKTITQNLGFAFNDGFTAVHQPGAAGGNVYGWDDPVFTLKYKFYVSAAHEFMASVGVQREFGGLGAVDHGLADNVGWTQPTLYAGKGFGDLPSSWGPLRAFAVTGELGYQLSDTAADPDAINYAFSVQYPLQYLRAQVKDYGFPGWVNNLIPLVEFSCSTPASSGRSGANTTGTIAPGLLYEGDVYQLGIEALIPATRSSGNQVGMIVQLHFYLDDIFPNSLGKPLF